MNRIIINNKTDLSDYDSLQLVARVIGSGRISNFNKQYCFLTEFKLKDKTVKVFTDLRDKSDSFTII